MGASAEVGGREITRISDVGLAESGLSASESSTRESWRFLPAASSDWPNRIVRRLPETGPDDAKMANDVLIQV